jgi:pimeloyl-ACP methyl ester carboxylesterase
MDLATLRAAQPDQLQRAAQDWDAACSRLEKLAAEFRAQTGTLFEGSWAGAAADAASASLSGLSARLTATSGDMAAMAALYRDAAMGVSGAQALLRTAEDLAASNGLVIGASGEVSLAAPAVAAAGARLPGPGAMITAMPPAAQEAADLVARALALAGEVDHQVSAQLARLPGSAAAVPAAGRLAGEIGREMMPPEGLAPGEAHDWWQALSKQAQDQLIREFPATIGWMNGLPATARNAANRLAMSQEKASLERELAQLEAHPPPATDYLGAKAGYVPSPAFMQWQAQVAGIEHELAGISSVARALALGGHAGLPPAYLLGFSSAGIGKAIVAFGNPDTAATTVTYVPGVGTALTGALSNSQRAANLWLQAHRADPGRSLSSIFWLDYNAPRRGLSLAGLMADRQIGSIADAVAGAKSLAGFQAGLAAAHVAGVPDRTVLLGHSYGSLVVGEAAAHDGVRPDDIIFVGSPGVGVNHAAQLGIPAGHVWAGANVNDPIPDMPPHAETLLPKAAEDSAVGAAVSLVTRTSLAKGAEEGALLPLMLAHLQVPNASYYGTNPATPAFGGNDFTANAVPGEPPGFSLPYFLTFKAHSSYWAPGSASLLNMARIVNGQYGLVSPAPGSPAGSGA